MSIFTNSSAAAPEETAGYIQALLDLLGDREPLAVLATLDDELERLVAGLSPAQLRASERPGKWSVVEVLAHLSDSDLVWGFRLRMVLAHDRPPLAGYDQDLWAERLRYRERDPGEERARLRVLRRSNLELLRSLRSDEWQRVGVHQERGEESIAHMTRLYAGHDLVHLRQLARIRAAVAG